MEEKKLTLKEIERIFGYYAKPFEDSESILTLKQLRYITADDILKVCSAYDSMTIGGTKITDWTLTRERLEVKIEIKKDQYFYHIDLVTGNIYNACNGRVLATGSNANVVQFFYQNNYALPAYFGIGHWANRKLPFELNLAVPDRRLLAKMLVEIFNKDQQKIYDWQADKDLHGVNLNDVNIYNETIEDLCREYKLEVNNFL